MAAWPEGFMYVGSSNIRKNSRVVIISKWHSKISHGSNTFLTPSQTTVALRYTILYYTDPLAADERSRKNSTTLERQPGGNNETNEVTVRGFPIDASGEWETSNLIVVALLKLTPTCRNRKAFSHGQHNSIAV